LSNQDSQGIPKKERIDYCYRNVLIGIWNSNDVHTVLKKDEEKWTEEKAKLDE
jgi:hypothetical protein